MALLERPTEVNKTSRNWRVWLRWVNGGLAALFGVALAVQLVRGKLWIVGSAGVWVLCWAMVGVGLVRLGLEKPDQVKRLMAWLVGRLTPYGVAVLFLTGLGLWLRMWGQHNGLPYVIPSDERATVDAGTHILKTGDYDPQIYYYPLFYSYLETVVAGLNFLWGSLTGVYKSLSDLPDHTYAITTAPQIFLWERTFTALWGAAAIPVAYMVVKKLWRDRRAAVLAAGLIALSSLAVEHSHYVTVDMPMATLSLLALWPTWNIVERGRRRDYILTGLIIGLTISTKWNGVSLLILPLLAHLLRLVRTRPTGAGPAWSLRRYLSANLLWSLATVALALLVTTPYLLARVKGFSDAFGTNVLKYRFSNAEYATDQPWLGNLQAIWEDSAVLFWLGLGGILLLAWRRWAADWLALSFPVIYLLSINGYRLIYRRNVLPLTVFFAIFAALFMVWLFDLALARLPRLDLQRFGPAFGWTTRFALPLLVVWAVMYAPWQSNLYADDFNDRPFSYARVEDWLRKEVGPGPLKLVEMRPQQWGSYPNLLTRVAEQGANDFGLAYYRERGIQFVAINRDRVAGEAVKGSYPELLRPGLIAQEFETKAVGQPGPAFTVVRTGVTPQTLKLQHPFNADFGSKVRLLGLNAGRVAAPNDLFLPPPDAKITPDWPTFKPGEVIGLTTYWQVVAPLGGDYVVFVHLKPVGNPTANLANRDTQPLLGAYPTSRWKIGEIVTDNPDLALPPSLPPGDYDLELGLYLDDGKFTPLPLSDGSNALPLGQIKVTKP